MKNFLQHLFVLFAMVVMLAACNSSHETETSSTSGTTSESETKTSSGGSDSNLMVYTQKTLDQYFHVALQEKVEEAVRQAGYAVEVANSNNDPTLQINQMQNYIAKMPAAIIANAIDSDALNDVTKAVRDAGIPVVMVDNPASTAVVDATIAYDNYNNGKMAAEIIVEKLIEKYGEAKGRVVNVYGALSSESWRLRKEGFDEVIRLYSTIDYVEVPGEGEQAKSQEALTNVIAQYAGDIDAVTCPSDAPGLGVAEALKIAGMWYPAGNEKHIIVVTGDGEPEAVQYVIDGYYDAIVVEDAYAYGPMAVDMLTTYILQKKTVPTTGTYTNEDFFWKTATFEVSERGPVLKVPPYVLDASNVNEDGHWGVAALKK